MIRASQWLAVIWTCLLALPTAHAAVLHYSPSRQLLQRHVVEWRGGPAPQEYCAGLRRDHAPLSKYLAATSAVSRAEFDGWPKDDRLAVLINACNARTVRLIVDPDPRLKSILYLGSMLQSPWSKRFIPLLGETRSLDDIEHELMRDSGRFGDPRTHSTGNCASIGCPALDDEQRRRLAADAMRISFPCCDWRLNGTG